MGRSAPAPRALAVLLVALLGALVRPGGAVNPEDEAVIAGCVRLQTPFCQNVDYQVPEASARAAFDAKLEQQLITGYVSFPGSRECQRRYRDLMCREIYPRCDASNPPRLPCRSACTDFVEDCQTRFSCDAFPEHECYDLASPAAAPAALSAVLLPALALAGAVAPARGSPFGDVAGAVRDLAGAMDGFGELPRLAPAPLADPSCLKNCANDYHSCTNSCGGEPVCIESCSVSYEGCSEGCDSGGASPSAAKRDAAASALAGDAELNNLFDEVAKDEAEADVFGEIPAIIVPAAQQPASPADGSFEAVPTVDAADPAGVKGDETFPSLTLDTDMEGLELADDGTTEAYSETVIYYSEPSADAGDDAGAIPATPTVDGEAADPSTAAAADDDDDDNAFDMAPLADLVAGLMNGAADALSAGGPAQQAGAELVDALLEAAFTAALRADDAANSDAGADLASNVLPISAEQEPADEVLPIQPEFPFPGAPAEPEAPTMISYSSTVPLPPLPGDSSEAAPAGSADSGAVECARGAFSEYIACVAALPLDPSEQDPSQMASCLRGYHSGLAACSPDDLPAPVFTAPHAYEAAAAAVSNVDPTCTHTCAAQYGEVLQGCAGNGNCIFAAMQTYRDCVLACMH